MKSIAVFCGASDGNDPGFSGMARTLGKILTEKKITLVYGGSKIGLMGAVADSVLASGGQVIGVLPTFLGGKEIAHPGLTRLIHCESMHERKTKMFELSEGFIAMPGGFGTLEEVAEILTWQQLGLHKFPIGFLNVNGFFDHLQLFFDEMKNKGLLKPENRDRAIFATDPNDLLLKMKNYQAPEVNLWIKKAEL